MLFPLARGAKIWHNDCNARLSAPEGRSVPMSDTTGQARLWGRIVKGGRIVRSETVP